MEIQSAYPVLLRNPYVWFFFSGIACGASISRATRRIKSDDIERAKSYKWTFFCLYLCLSIILAVVGVLATNTEKLKDINILYIFTATTGLFFFVFRFKKAVALPLILMLVLLMVTVLLFFQSLNALTGETEIARIRVLTFKDSQMRLEIARPDSESLIIDMHGEYFAPIIKVIIFDDLFVFLGQKTWYRFIGMTSFQVVKEADGMKFRQADTDYYFEHPTRLSETLYDFFENNEKRIPGVKAVQIEVDLKRVRDVDGAGLETFSVRIQNDGGTQIILMD